MEITRSRLTKIVAEEVRRRLRELVEADDDKPEGKKPRKPETADAGESPSPKVQSKTGGNTGTVSTPNLDQDEDPDGPAVDGDQPDPEAEEEEADAVDPEGDGGDEPSGAVNNEVSGKSIQSITLEPKSKVLPGSKEVVIAFNDVTDTLRVLVTPTGQVKFFWRGQLHDLP